MNFPWSISLLWGNMGEVRRGGKGKREGKRERKGRRGEEKRVGKGKGNVEDLKVSSVQLSEFIFLVNH